VAPLVSGVSDASAAAAPPAGAGFTYASAELDAMAGAVNYYGAILEHFVPHVGRDVVEIGAGIGTVAARLLDETARAGRPLRRLTLVEPAENNAPLLARRFAGGAAAARDDGRGGATVDVRSAYFGDVAGEIAAGGGVDSVVMVNVLEHVPDDAALLADIHRVLRRGGRLCLFVPALPALYGTLDAAFEHHRRYTAPGIRGLLERAGLRPLDVRYMNFAGVVPWFVAGRVLRRCSLAPSAVRLYDRLVTPWVRRLERHWTPPLGQSVLAIAER
jgi:SAM-dependent methyltransferase